MADHSHDTETISDHMDYAQHEATWAVFTNLVPAFGVLLSAGLLGEAVLASMLVGGVVSVVGVSLTNRK